jgi:hypothetical protein
MRLAFVLYKYFPYGGLQRDMLRIAAGCRAAGVCQQGPDDLLAQSLWSAVHGLISLLQQGQVSSAVLDHHTPKDLLFFTLSQMTNTLLDPRDF